MCGQVKPHNQMLHLPDENESTPDPITHRFFNKIETLDPVSDSTKGQNSKPNTLSPVVD